MKRWSNDWTCHFCKKVVRTHGPEYELPEGWGRKEIHGCGLTGYTHVVPACERCDKKVLKQNDDNYWLEDSTSVSGNGGRRPSLVRRRRQTDSRDSITDRTTSSTNASPSVGRAKEAELEDTKTADGKGHYEPHVEER